MVIRQTKFLLWLAVIALIAIVTTIYYFRMQTMTQDRLYVYSIVRDDDDPSPNAVMKKDVTDLVNNQGYKLLDRQHMWTPEGKRPALSTDDWRRIKQGFVRAAKLVLPKEEWLNLEKFEPQKSTRYVVTSYFAYYPSYFYETIYSGISRKIVMFPVYSENRSRNIVDVIFECMPGGDVIPSVSFEPCDHKLWEQFKHGELDFLLKLKDL
jgi:hypothetical protein